MRESLKTVALFVGGGPAPGINGVISASTIEARNCGWRVLGILDGLRWLERGDLTKVVELDIQDVSRIHLRGGSILRISRDGHVDDPEVCARVLDGLKELGVDALVAIGGDGTAGAARLLAEAGEPWLRVYHVPKTIDNDIPLPGGLSTFGFQTARHRGVEVVDSLMRDARAIGRWYLVVTMGRQAGHLALGIGKAASATLTLIPEEFQDRPIGLDDLARPIEGAIIRRLAVGRTDGVVVLAEGLAELLREGELEQRVDAELDPHGKVRLTDLPLGLALRRRITSTFDERGIEVSIMEKLVGYELRCANPIPFDAEYTRDLGFGAMRAVVDGREPGIVYRREGRIRTKPFADFVDDATGRMRVRFVDTDSEQYRVSAHYQLRIRPEDLDDWKQRARLAKAAGLDEDAFVARFA